MMNTGEAVEKGVSESVKPCPHKQNIRKKLNTQKEIKI